jgi:hypothetical protein
MGQIWEQKRDFEDEQLFRMPTTKVSYVHKSPQLLIIQSRHGLGRLAVRNLRLCGNGLIKGRITTLRSLGQNRQNLGHIVPNCTVV